VTFFYRKNNKNQSEKYTKILPKQMKNKDKTQSKEECEFRVKFVWDKGKMKLQKLCVVKNNATK